MDNFKDQLVRVESNGLYKVAKVLMYVFAVLALLSLSFFRLTLVAIFGILSGLLFFFKKELYVEYEYSLTNGEIDIDKIMEMRSRKRIISFHMKEVELLAPVDSNEYKGFSSKPESIIKAFPKEDKSRQYAAIVTGGGKRLQVLFVPNKELLDLCFLYNPKAVKKNI